MDRVKKQEEGRLVCEPFNCLRFLSGSDIPILIGQSRNDWHSLAQIIKTNWAEWRNQCQPQQLQTLQFWLTDQNKSVRAVEMAAVFVWLYVWKFWNYFIRLAFFAGLGKAATTRKALPPETSGRKRCTWHSTHRIWYKQLDLPAISSTLPLSQIPTCSAALLDYFSYHSFDSNHWWSSKITLWWRI